MDCSICRTAGAHRIVSGLRPPISCSVRFGSILSSRNGISVAGLRRAMKNSASAAGNRFAAATILGPAAAKKPGSDRQRAGTPISAGCEMMIRSGASLSRMESSSTSSISGVAGPPDRAASASSRRPRWREGGIGSMPCSSIQPRLSIRARTVRSGSVPWVPR